MKTKTLKEIVKECQGDKAYRKGFCDKIDITEQNPCLCRYQQGVTRVPCYKEGVMGYAIKYGCCK